MKLEDDKGTILQYLQSRMSMLAPNLTHLVGPSLAALLVGMAGGLADLARVPACNMTVMGQEKRYLGGFGMVAGMPHTGVLYFCDLVQQAPPDVLAELMQRIKTIDKNYENRPFSYKDASKNDKKIWITGWM